MLIYKSDLLNISETFIRDQAQAFQGWKAVFAGLQQVPGLSLQGFEVHLLANSPEQSQSFLLRALRRLHLPHPGFVRLLRRLQVKLVHVHFGTDAVDFWPAAKWLHVPVVVTLHGYDIMTHTSTWKEMGGGRAHYPRRLLDMSGSDKVHFIAVSNAVRRRAIEFGLPEDRVTVHYTGIDCAKFQRDGLPLSERRRRILFVGRLVEKKGARFLIEAYAKLLQRVPDAELTLVGDGPLRGDLESFARTLGVPVVFTGSQTPTEIRKHLSEARAFCLPSVTASNGDAEGFGMVLLEAQACGVPVATSALGGAQEGMLEGVTGFAFAERDVDGLVVALEKLLTDDELATRMSDAAPRFVAENFDLQRCTRLLEQFYDRILERSP